MTDNFRMGCILPLLLWFCSPPLLAGTLHQTLQVQLEPQAGRLQVTAQIDLPQTAVPRFLLHQGLAPRSDTPGVTIEAIESIDGPVPLTAYRIRLPDDAPRRFQLLYGGEITHNLTAIKESPGRSSERLAGTIAPQGVHLDGATGWYPHFPGQLQTFELSVALPEDWLVVSQGTGPDVSRTDGERWVSWRASHPQDEIYLIAAPFHLYRRPVGEVEAQVFLRTPDEPLAVRYLDATADYLRLYTQLIGQYPYAKFALVENFWQTGYGMPSFTLLGSRVIRLPFIVHTSYPHEILHNWWGNSVYVDYAQGNWSEGLTSYLADHLLAEQQGRGSGYRRSALQRYADFVRQDNDFPLREFRGRHSTASQAVGYDKSLMLFHMLRRMLGDARFIDGLQNFYRDNRFRTAGFAQLQAAFEAAAERPLGDFFRQWVERTGAPRLMLEQPRSEPTAQGYRVSGYLHQTQAQAPFQLQVPLVVRLSDGTTHSEGLHMTRRRQAFRIDLPAAPLALDVDPWFDLFRTLDPAETPPSLSQFFGAEQVLILLPADADESLREGYRRLAERWAGDFRQARVLLDNQVDRLPQDSPVLLLGWENRFRPGFIDSLTAYPFSQSPGRLTFWDQAYELDSHSFALAARPDSAAQTRLLITTPSADSLPGLTRKLPHYGKYSVLAFAGDAPDNRMKRQWPVTGSPLQTRFAEEPLAPLKEPSSLVPK